MTGAACLWCVVAIFFALATCIILIVIASEGVQSCLTWKETLIGFSAVCICGMFVLIASYQCQNCYDVNFAVAMKNINYTRTTEVNNTIEMNYQDITKEDK